MVQDSLMINLSIDSINFFDIIIVGVILILFLSGIWKIINSIFALKKTITVFRYTKEAVFNELGLSTLNFAIICFFAIFGPVFIQRIILATNLVGTELPIEMRAIIISIFGQFSGCVILYIIWRLNKHIFSSMNCQKIGVGRAFLFSIKTYAISLPIVFLASIIWQYFLSFFGIKPTNQPIIELLINAKFSAPMIVLLGVFVTIIAPITEEIIFRGIIYRFFASKFTNISALMLSATFFAALHLHMSSFLPLLILGIMLGWLYFYSGSLLTNICLHGLFNFVNYVLLLRFCIYA